jgi:hypothetical protein
VIAVTFDGQFLLPPGALTGLADKVLHFAERLVCEGSGAIAYLDRYVGSVPARPVLIDAALIDSALIDTGVSAWCAARFV